MNHAVENIFMSKFKLLTLFFISFILFLNGKAQTGNIPIGTWRFHTSFNNAKTIVQVENKIYCGTEGGLFYLDKDENSINKISKLDGLSDLEINALFYHQPTKSIVIGYKSGNIDVIKNNTIINIPHIINATNITGSKSINAINAHKNTAIIACDFGVVLLNLVKLEIQETWLNIGENGSSLLANDVISIADSVFIASTKGLYASKFDTKNLMDFNNWKKLPIISTSPNIAVNKLAATNLKLFAVLEGKGVYKKDTAWKLKFNTTQAITALSGFNDKTWLFSAGKLGSITNQDSTNQSLTEVGSVNAIVTDQADNKMLWMADENEGLVKYNTISGEINKYLPNGPLNNLVFNLKAIDDNVFHFSGGPEDRVTTPAFRNGNYSYFTKGEWFGNKRPSELGLRDFSSVELNRQNGKFYFASTSDGIIEKNGNDFKAYYEGSCPVVEFTGHRVMDIYYDSNTEILWFVNISGFSNAPSIRKFNNGNCEGFTYPLYVGSTYPMQILPDNAGNVWVRGNEKFDAGVFVFNESSLSGGLPIYKRLIKGVSVGNLSDIIVRCMIKDRNGDIWMGTNNGVCVFYNPQSIVSMGTLDATIPIYENRPLLFDQVATCIDVDGGNRKWIGTNNGIYLFNAEGNKVVHYFNTENSPLLSNAIVSVAVNQKTGEVFIGTDKGIVSFREAATKGEDNEPSVLIFPNPVKTNYSGAIGFSGLATDAVVKITDINGRLLYEANANGGTAQWNGRDYNGKKIEPGVYVVLTSKSDGSGTATGKLFVLD